MRERLVGVGHSVGIILLLDRVAAIVSRVENFSGKPVNHRLLSAPARIRDQPSDGKAIAARFLINLDGHLISRATDAARFDFDAGLNVVYGFLKGFQRVFLCFPLDLAHSAIENIFGHCFLAAPHKRVDELGHHRRVVYRVRQNIAFRCYSSSWHTLSKLMNDRLEVTSASSLDHLFFSRSGFLRSLGSVLGATLLAIRNTDSIESAANNVIAHARQIFYAASANEHNRVLLQIVADAWDVSRNFDLIGQAHARNLAQSRVRLLGRLRVNTCADAAFLRA